ncbi:hypothetical protein [Methylobacterium radiotolerans]|uniref:Uncharacterized protein n=1 Tax=Methylobacterium radiotolerans (strain ATCC 27329 / DSM 1819 / JCM 2831 / NBRC 15690 / NCIMB 10815 / 0-1) TaxID=426355 RepID=B1M9R1_METRJ|nr:hypothetical protein [Methylobacterium radiotolerans]ACB28236.1 hypothetical protein Mrad2831_6314 [Methylobacterium radiotolerans JCM 2831]GEN01758.1 hypothetical protein MRA01_62970 [Methylobacterium radiotolerans]
MNMEPIELAAILAGLRLLQRHDVLPDDIDAILTDAGPRITEADIDALCERINAGELVRANAVSALVKAARDTRSSLQHMRGPEVLIHARAVELDAALSGLGQA